MSRLKQVLQKEMKRIVEGVSDRPDRMVPYDSDENRGSRWYETVEDFAEGDETLEEAMKRGIAEEYVRYRDTADQDVEDKAGISEFDVNKREDRSRWFEPDQFGKEQLDEATIKRVVKRAIRKLK